MSLIEKLRSFGAIDESDMDRNDERRDFMEELELYPEVDNEFRELGRWSNYETKVYKVEENGEVAYFEYGREIPATEMQDGMDCSWHFHEVFPKKVVKTIYVSTKPKE